MIFFRKPPTRKSNPEDQIKKDLPADTFEKSDDEFEIPDLDVQDVLTSTEREFETIKAANEKIR